MRERFQRCRYYPNCMIHTGDRLVADIGMVERREMWMEWRLGLTTGEIGRVHHLDYRQVYRIVQAIETFQKTP